jgi:hypothetical protein
MLGRLGTLGVVLATAMAPVGTASASQDTAATHAYLTAGYQTLHGAIASMGRIGKSIDKLNVKYRGECSHAGAGSPQNEEAQQLSYEVFGALETTAYDTDATLVESFGRTVEHLKWSNATVTRDARHFATSLQELVDLPLPDLCGDVRTWSANGFGKAPASTIQFDKRLEDIEGAPVPWKLLAKYVAPADKALATRDEKLYTQLTNLETVRGQDWWNETLETLALNQ